jgi:hypothetical protein
MNGFFKIVKQIILKIFAVLLIILVLISPYFLLIDFKTFSPLVLTVWLLSAAYYVFVKAREKK